LRALIEVPAALRHEARRELIALGWNGRDRLVFVHPGAGGRGKRWPAAGFATVLERVAARPGHAVLIHQGPADSEAVAALATRLTARAISLREPPLPLLAGALTHVAAYLGNDSGISHLAAAVGVPSTVLFGADRLIWRPWAEHVEPLVVSLAELDEGDTARVTAALTRGRRSASSWRPPC
ncbi:MAG: glycosyltransferase family 9 protein, partial [Candidatus Rokuibacteriota bacterium]